MPYCKHCGTNNGDDVKFCTSCGQPMTASAEQKSETTTPEKEQSAAQAQNANAQNEPIKQNQNQFNPPMQDANPYQQNANGAQYQNPNMQNSAPYQQQYQQYQQPGGAYYAPQQFVDPNAAPPKGSRFAPMSPLAYAGLFFLFTIPCIGFILLLVFAFVGDNENRKNFARGYLLYGIIMALIGIITAIIAGAAFGSFFELVMEELGTGYYYY